MDWRRLGSHSRIRSDNSYRLRINQKSGFGSRCNLRDVGFSYALLIEFLNNLCGGSGRLEALLGDGSAGSSNGSVVAEVDTVVSPALAAVVAVISIGAAITSRLPLKVARRPVASLTRVGTRVVA